VVESPETTTVIPPAASVVPVRLTVPPPVAKVTVPELKPTARLTAKPDWKLPGVIAPSRTSEIFRVSKLLTVVTAAWAVAIA